MSSTTITRLQSATARLTALQAEMTELTAEIAELTVCLAATTIELDDDSDEEEYVDPEELIVGDESDDEVAVGFTLPPEGSAEREELDAIGRELLQVTSYTVGAWEEYVLRYAKEWKRDCYNNKLVLVDWANPNRTHPDLIDWSDPAQAAVAYAPVGTPGLLK